MVEDAIRSAPAQVMLAGRTPERDVLLDNNANAYLNFGGGINVVDPNSGATRQSTKADLAASARLCDALKEVSVYSRAVYPLDQPQKVLHLHTAEACFNNTAKPFLNSPESKWGVEKIIEILETHQPEPLPGGAAERIRSIVEEAEKEVGVK